ncbi:MAG: hypothetical protein IJD91_01070, partial [Clostridia bacterium]|nr:hypothetical protein [Clostridia bacterium]
IARTVDGTQRRSYDDKNKNIPSDLQYFLQSQIKKIPWASQNLEPYVDAWGRQEKIENVFARAINNMFSPGYYSQINASPMENELQRLYKEVGSEDGMKLFPTSAVKKFNLSDGTEKNLTAKEYTTIQTVQGQTAYDLLTGIVKSKSYKDVDDFTKGKIVSKVYEVASANGKKAVAGNEWNPDSKWISEALTLIEKGDYKGAEKYIIEKGIEEVEDSRYEASRNEYKESFVYDASDYSESEINIMDKVESDAATYYASVEKGREYNEGDLRHIKVYDEKLSDTMPIEEYAGVRAYAKKTAAMEDGKPSMKKDELYDYLESTDYPRSVKSALFEAIGDKGWINPYTRKKIQ